MACLSRVAAKLLGDPHRDRRVAGELHDELGPPLGRERSTVENKHLGKRPLRLDPSKAVRLGGPTMSARLGSTHHPALGFGGSSTSTRMMGSRICPPALAIT